MTSKFILIGIAVALLWTGAVFFAGRATKQCAQILVPPQAVKAPETKPLVPDTVWQKKVVLRVDTLWQSDTFWRAETLWREGKGFKPVVFANRWPHSGDTALVWGEDSLTLIPFGFVPQIATEGLEGGKSGVFTRRPLLEFGFVSVFRDPTAFGTIPLPREKRAFYLPHRGGVSYKFKEKELDLAVGWAL